MKKIKTILLVAGIIMITGCATSNTKNDEQKALSEQKSAEKATEKTLENSALSTNGLGITDEKYARSIEISLLNAGNNYLLKNTLEKLKAGEEKVYIAALGGSVTEGAGPSHYSQGYAYQFNKLVKEKYAKNPDLVEFVGAGIGGTPSPMGLIRYQKDVVDVLNHKPDLLIIEFSVNDWQECSNTRGFEYMIRNALKNGTAVISLYAAATYGNQQTAMSPVARFYKIPEVSISNALDYSGIDKTKDSNIYYTDMVHPTKNGHKFMADCILNLLDKADAAEFDEPFEIPEGYKNKKPFTNYHTVYGNTADENVVISKGGFNKVDSVIQNYMKGGKSFPDNWYYDGKTAEQFKMELNCKNLIIIYKNSNAQTFGKADVFVDGVKKTQLNGCDGTGWNNCVVTMIIDEEESGNHTIEIKMAENEENKSFTILAFGYDK